VSNVKVDCMAKIKKIPKDYPDVIIPETKVEEPMIAYQVETNFWKQAGISTNLHSDLDTLDLIKKGVKKSVLSKCMDLFDFSLEEMADIIHTSDRTLRRYTSNTVLNMEQSERVIELAKLYNVGKDVFGSLEAFNAWMQHPLQAFNFQMPKQFLNTSLGIKLIHSVLAKIEYGIYS
jgi:putative toxin-antitoxin system antitoxin component (TIGR02293 family)